jgi:hypothetical protein
MEFTYSTLFNIDYIDKGLALYNSIRTFNTSSVIYILCMDSITKSVLEKRSLVNTVLVSIGELEDLYVYLRELKRQRSFAEYCWTLTPHIIEFVFTTYGAQYNTYLDSDLYFFDDPDVLNIEMINNNCNTLITEHRFVNDKGKSLSEKMHGKYCVQYNTFTNCPESLALLKRWKTNVIADCEYNKKKQKAGDQKYLEEFPLLSKAVYIPKNIGVGVAPWNIKQYRLVEQDGKRIIITDTNKKASILFYHYQNIKYISDKIVNIGAGRCDRCLKERLYYPYLKEVDDIRKQLRSEVVAIKSRSVSRNRVLAFIQKYAMKFKLRECSISDILILKN